MIRHIIHLIKESIKNPEKFIWVFKKKYLTIPSLDFLKKIKSKKIKLFYISFWTFFSKKNLSFKNLYFKDSEVYNQFIFDFNQKNIVSEEIIKSLSYNGIVILENILNHDNLNKLKTKIEEIEFLKKNEKLSSSDNYRLNISEDKKRERFVYDPKNLNYFELNQLTNSFSSLVYGKKLAPTRDLYIDYCHEIPEMKIRGDNFLHVDRFLPNLKILFSPFEITLHDAPFSYAINSHKINKDYKNFFTNAEFFDETDEGALKFIQKKKIITMKSNSAIIALTNGFHGRTSFERKGKRIILFHQFNRSFSKLSFFNFLNFNKNNKHFSS
tara:strand:+ start:5946 stop:6923 length:978 start_codon:yes stop_codon:yes gene_type:complete